MENSAYNAVADGILVTAQDITILSRKARWDSVTLRYVHHRVHIYERAVLQEELGTDQSSRCFHCQQ